MNRIIGTRPFLSVKGMAKLVLFLMGCLLLFISLLFYLMGDKMNEGIAKLPAEGSKVNSREFQATSFAEQKGTTGFLMRELMLVAVYQVKTAQEVADVLVDVASVAEFEREANSGNVKIQFAEGRRPGFYPDMESVKERMVTAVKSPWRGRLFGLVAFVTSIFGERNSQESFDKAKDSGWKIDIALGVVLLFFLHYMGERRRRIFTRNFKEKDLAKATECVLVKVRHPLLLRGLMFLLRIEDSLYQIDGTSLKLFYSGQPKQKLNGRYLEYEGHCYFFPNK